MRIKSFFAKTVDEGIAQARAEMGQDALLLNTRRVGGQAGLPSGYEVVFGNAEEPAVPVRVKAAAPQVAAAQVKDVREFRPAPVEAEAPKFNPPPIPKSEPRETALHSTELEQLREQIDEIRNLLVRSSSTRISIGRSVPELADVYARLMAAEVEPLLAKDIVDRLEASMATDAFFFKTTGTKEPGANRWKSLRFDSRRLEAFIRAEMRERIAIDPQIQSGVVAFVGPTGAGKTTSLMKIASAEAAQRQVRILTLDTSRAAALVQLQSFAGRIGAAFAAVQSAQLLPAMVTERKEELVMIDTPGFAGHGGQDAEQAAMAFAACGVIETHLVAPGYMKATDLRRSIARYGMFRPAKLLATKLDETQTFGSVFSEAARAGLALSFLAHGPSVPADIRAASIEDLVAMALESSAVRAECA